MILYSSSLTGGEDACWYLDWNNLTASSSRYNQDKNSLPEESLIPQGASSIVCVCNPRSACSLWHGECLYEFF